MRKTDDNTQDNAVIENLKEEIKRLQETDSISNWFSILHPTLKW
jgi:hypothetical protein